LSTKVEDAHFIWDINVNEDDLRFLWIATGSPLRLKGYRDQTEFKSAQELSSVDFEVILLRLWQSE
jgi:hypothetical protein